MNSYNGFIFGFFHRNQNLFNSSQNILIHFNIKISKGDFPRPDNYDTLRFDCNVHEPDAIFAEDVFSDDGDEDLYNNGELFMGGADSILKK